MSGSSAARPPASPQDLDLARLADTELSEWPSLARTWIDVGFRSQALIDFAGLTPGEAPVLADLMIDVLRSLGLQLTIERDIANHVFMVSGFEQRCRKAISRPGSDLQRTWRDVEVSLLASDQWGTPPVFVQTLVGDYNSPGTEPLTAGMANDELVETSAKQISDTLHEHIGVRWPLCVEHGKIMTPYTPPARPPTLQPSWWCDLHSQPTAPIGELNTSSSVFETMWWSARRTLPPLRV